MQLPMGFFGSLLGGSQQAIPPSLLPELRAILDWQWPTVDAALCRPEPTPTYAPNPKPPQLLVCLLCRPPLLRCTARAAVLLSLPLSPAFSCLLFASPEVYTSNYKTDFRDKAFDAVRQKLGDPNRHTNMWAWDVEEGGWRPSSEAATLLHRHNARYWNGLVGSNTPCRQQGLCVS